MDRSFDDLRPYLSEKGWAALLKWRLEPVYEADAVGSLHRSFSPRSLANRASLRIGEYSAKHGCSENDAREAWTAVAETLPPSWSWDPEEWLMSKV